MYQFTSHIYFACSCLCLHVLQSTGGGQRTSSTCSPQGLDSGLQTGAFTHPASCQSPSLSSVLLCIFETGFYVALASLIRLQNLQTSLSTSRVLGLKACTCTPGVPLLLLNFKKKCRGMFLCGYVQVPEEARDCSYWTW